MLQRFLPRSSILSRTSVRFFSSESSAKPAILVYGGNGALGRSIVNRFENHGWDTISGHSSYISSLLQRVYMFIYYSI